jgi:hypothetical protein
MSVRTDDDARRKLIAEAAYFRAERRGFEGGDPVADWVEAEAEVDSVLQRREHGQLVERLEQRLAEAAKKAEALKKKTRSAKTEARAEVQHELERLNRLRDALEHRVEEISRQGVQASRKLLEQAEELWHELAELVAQKRPRKTSKRSE